MSTITITIELPDAASDLEANDRAFTLSWILHTIANRQQDGFDDEIVRDENGNRVGKIAYENWEFEQ